MTKLKWAYSRHSAGQTVSGLGTARALIEPSV
jgi:hypothetical protein